MCHWRVASATRQALATRQRHPSSEDREDTHRRATAPAGAQADRPQEVQRWNTPSISNPAQRSLAGPTWVQTLPPGRTRHGNPGGTFDVDWAIAFRLSEHELSGEFGLKNPADVSFVLPDNVAESIGRSEYKHEILAKAPEDSLH